MKKITIWLFGGIVVALTLIAIWVNVSAPKMSGRVVAKELSKPVQILRDEFGVPHIFAETQKDAYFALGYAQAQDRLFQMDLARHAVSGRLAEWLGAAAIPRDKKMRVLGLHYHAEEWLKRHPLAPKSKEALDAYLAGINAFAEANKTLEHRFLGVRAEPFTEADTLAMIGFMGFGFAQALTADPLYSALEKKLGEEKMRALWPDYTPGGALSISDGDTAALFDFRHDVLAAFTPFEGSNAWAVAPSHSKSGQALLANDPHIGFSNPSVWWEAQICAPGLSVYGHYLALVPFPALGQTEDLAWGLTMYENDDMDLFAETLRDDEALFEGAYEPLHKREETIVVKGQDAVHVTIRESRHGPLVSDAFDKLPNTPLALQWAFFRDDNDPLHALAALPETHTLQDFQNALHAMLAPGLAIVYADKAGHIALFDTGILPRKNDKRGIRSGETGDDEWNDVVPPEEWPKSIDPKSGFVVTANNKPLDGLLDTNDGDYALQGYWQPAYRATRITELLRSQPKWSRDEMRNIQNDVSVSSAKHFLSVLLPLVADAPDKAIAARLGKWNLSADIDAAEPLIYAEWRKALIHEIFADEMSEREFEEFSQLATAQHALEAALNDPDYVFWDDTRTQEKETPEIIAKRALKIALDDITAKLGAQKKWRWGALHTLEFRHPFSLQSKLAAGFFNLGPFPVAGANESVDNMHYKDDFAGGNFKVVAGPSTRRLIDFADLHHPLSILPTGESGNRLSTHYGDQTHLFTDAGYRHVALEKNEINVSDTLDLVTDTPL